MAEPYTGDKTIVVLSFAIQNGGDVFAHDLRNRIMKEFNYFSQNAVYLDNVASRNVGDGQQINHAGNFDSATLAKAKDAGIPLVGPDTRNNPIDPRALGVRPGGYVPIGAINSDWQAMWMKALGEAKAVIQVYTTEYGDSKNCQTEMAAITQEANRRGKDLTVVVLTFPGGPPYSMAMPRARVVPVPCVQRPMQGPLGQMKGTWQIPESSYDSLFAQLKSAGC